LGGVAFKPVPLGLSLLSAWRPIPKYVLGWRVMPTIFFDTPQCWLKFFFPIAAALAKLIRLSGLQL